MSIFLIAVVLNSCQFTRHGVRRVNPYSNTQGVSKALSIPELKTKNISEKYYQSQDGGIEIKVLIYKGEKLDKKNNIILKGKQVNYGGKVYPLHEGQASLEVSADNPIIIGENGYFGKILITKKDSIYVVNALPLEEYLVGVVRKEISYSWPKAAIRAQAVVARSYAYRKYLENYDKLYHLKGDTSDQVFGGTLGSHENIIRGVEETQDKILVYDGYPILTFFHASCGGMTAKASEVWPSSEDLPYFQNIRCNFCTTHPRYSWEYKADVKTINQKLSSKLGKKVKSFNIKKFSSSERVDQMVLSTTEGREIITGNEFRLAVGATELFSTKFKIKRSGNTYSIIGNGFGHGVGLCQWGAKTMAEKGYSDKRILQFYYHKTKTSDIPTVEKKLRSLLAKN